MLATLDDGEHFGPEEGWAFEMKWDGVRAVAYLAGGRVRLLSRKGRDESAAYPDVVAPLARLDVRDAVLDGEIVVTDAAGRPDFGLLQNRINLSRRRRHRAGAQTWPAQLMVFDVLELDGRSPAAPPVRGAARAPGRAGPRRARGAGARAARVPRRPAGRAGHQPAAPARGRRGQADRLRLRPGRRGRTWLKIKNFLTQEVVVAGWRPGQGGRSGTFGSLLMGIPGPDGLRYVGRVGPASTAPRSTTSSAASTPGPTRPPRWSASPARTRATRTGCAPDLVGEVTYAELTGPGRMRHPVWRGLRPDKDAAEVVWERPAAERG